MVKYKRFTMKFKPGVYHLLCLNCPIGRHKCKIDDCKFALANRLGELEDKIESGELREVPRGAVILTPEERDEEMKVAREERVEFERRIELLKNELNRELFEHKTFIEKTAIEVGRLKAEKAQAVKEFAERLKIETTVENRLCVKEYDIGYNDGYSEAYYNFHKTIDELLEEYEK